MNWSRSGQQQRAKAQEQYAMMGSNPGLTYMVKKGFVIGKGLGDGKGRLGAPWGLQGRWVRSGTTTTLRTYMVPTMVPLFPGDSQALLPPPQVQHHHQLLADPGKAMGCSTNTLMIHFCHPKLKQKIVS